MYMYYAAIQKWFYGISTLLGYLNPKPPLVEDQKWYFLIHSWGIRGFTPFTKGIRMKLNLIAWLGFELAYYVITTTPLKHNTLHDSFLT